MAVSVATALLLAALFAGDSVWTAIAALLVAGGWSALALAGRARQPGGGAVLLGLLLATAAWAGLSVAWSVAPDRSWDELNRTLVFAAFLVVGLLLGACGPRACRWAAAALVAALGGSGASGRSPERRSRRSSPTAVARRACAIRSATGTRSRSPPTCCSCWRSNWRRQARSRAAVAGGGDPRLRGRRRGPPGGLPRRRCCGGARCRPLALALARPGPWRAARARRPVPAAALAAWAFSRPALVDDGYPRADRVADGAWFGLLLLAGACVVALAALELRRRPLSPHARRIAGARARRARDRGRPRRRGRRGRARGRESPTSSAAARSPTAPIASAASARTTASSGGARPGTSSRPTRSSVPAPTHSRSRGSATARPPRL